MKHRHLIAVAIAAATLSTSLAHATDTADTFPVTGNVAVTSDYIFRGLSQSWGGPAIQGGVDYANPGGFAAGVSGSSISERSYPGGTMELDLYANYGRAIGSGWSWRAGLYSYVYAGANLDQAGLPSRSLNTVEAHAALSWNMFTLKYSHALTDYFAADTEQGYRGDSKGTGYLQLDAAVPLAEAWTLGLHAAHTHYSTTLATPLAHGASDPSYSDFGATLTYQFARQWSLSGSVTHATNRDFYRHASSFLDAADTRNVGGTRGALMIHGAF